ncbi:MAG: response regulator [Thermotogae bacterium]|nr:response regulator [Thermotogota bacterium]
MARILIVDDSPLIRKMVRKALEPEGFQIAGEAKNGQEGVNLYKKLKPDVIVMDVTMPVKGGLDAAREILSDFPETKILLLSAMGDKELIQEAKSVGVKLNLQKPFKPKEIIDSIKKVVSS